MFLNIFSSQFETKLFKIARKCLKLHCFNFLMDVELLTSSKSLYSFKKCKKGANEKEN